MSRTKRKFLIAPWAREVKERMKGKKAVHWWTKGQVASFFTTQRPNLVVFARDPSILLSRIISWKAHHASSETLAKIWGSWLGWLEFFRLSYRFENKIQNIGIWLHFVGSEFVLHFWVFQNCCDNGNNDRFGLWKPQALMSMLVKNCAASFSPILVVMTFWG